MGASISHEDWGSHAELGMAQCVAWNACTLSSTEGISDASSETSFESVSSAPAVEVMSNRRSRRKQASNLSREALPPRTSKYSGADRPWVPSALSGPEPSLLASNETMSSPVSELSLTISDTDQAPDGIFITCATDKSTQLAPTTARTDKVRLPCQTPAPKTATLLHNTRNTHNTRSAALHLCHRLDTYRSQMLVLEACHSVKLEKLTALHAAAVSSSAVERERGEAALAAAAAQHRAELDCQLAASEDRVRKSDQEHEMKMTQQAARHEGEKQRLMQLLDDAHRSLAALQREVACGRLAGPERHTQGQEDERAGQNEMLGEHSQGGSPGGDGCTVLADPHSTARSSTVVSVLFDVTDCTGTSPPTADLPRFPVDHQSGCPVQCSSPIPGTPHAAYLAGEASAGPHLSTASLTPAPSAFESQSAGPAVPRSCVTEAGPAGVASTMLLTGSGSRCGSGSGSGSSVGDVVAGMLGAAGVGLRCSEGSAWQVPAGCRQEGLC